MKKLPTELRYIKRCGYCDHEETYCLRAPNVNTSITDDSARQMALQYVGAVGAAYCENCKMITEHKRVAYDFNEPLEDTPNAE